MKQSGIDTVFILLIVTFISVQSGYSSTNYVSPVGSHVFPFSTWNDAATNIQSAVDAAGSGDTVLIAEGTYMLSSTVIVTNSITLEGFGDAEQSIVNGGNQHRCFYLNSAWPVLRSVTVIDGQTPGVTWPDNIGGGAVLAVQGGSFESCTITANTSSNQGGGIYYFSVNSLVTSLVRNTILYHNTAAAGGDNYFDMFNGLLFDHSCTYPVITNGMDFGGTITNDPSFVDFNNGNYHISIFSPCRNAGTNRFWMLEATDLDGAPRIMEDVVDISSYETVPEPVALLLVPALIILAVHRRHGYTESV